MAKGPRPALVHWTDACDAPTEWTDVAKVAATKPVRCQSVGFVLVSDDEGENFLAKLLNRDHWTGHYNLDEDILNLSTN